MCALYIPGVAFGDVDLLSPVTLLEMPYSKWGARVSFSLDVSNFILPSTYLLKMLITYK